MKGHTGTVPAWMLTTFVAVFDALWIESETESEGSPVSLSTTAAMLGIGVRCGRTAAGGTPC